MSALTDGYYWVIYTRIGVVGVLQRAMGQWWACGYTTPVDDTDIQVLHQAEFRRTGHIRRVNDKRRYHVRRSNVERRKA